MRLSVSSRRGIRVSVQEPVPNQGLQATAYSVRFQPRLIPSVRLY
jgi:hypothetical protein